ncbi:MAG: molybdopterin-dependent oxidoreductase [Desulfobacter sp.]|nr:MAG: molybdopterin-dependent oxidoreductase [Desulfobacter sp.]
MASSYFVSCPMDCFDLCRFIVTAEDNRISGLKGDPGHPLTRGAVCRKARHLLKRHGDPRRVTRPLLRSEKGFIPVSYDRVFDLLAEKLTQVKKEFGPTAVLNYTSDGYGGMKNRSQSIFFNYWGGDSRFSGSLCWSAGMAAQKYDFGRAMGSDPGDVLNSDLVILWGRNPKSTNMHLYSLLTKARKTGTEIIVIDPVETPTAKAFSNHIRPAPGTDGALALAMIHVLMQEGLTDGEFIQAHVLGYDRLKKAIGEFTPEHAQEITGVAAATIRAAARRYARAKSASIFIGYGMQRYENGGNAVRSIDALAAAAGQLGRPGAGVHYAAKSLAPYLGAPEEDSLKNGVDRRLFPAPRLGAFMAGAQAPPVQMGFFSSGNPLVQTPDLNRAMEGFDAVPFNVVFDQFMTDTAARADLVLPAATVFEQDDLFATSMYSHILNFSQKAVEPPATLMPEFEFYLALGRHMGLEYGFSSSIEYLEQCAAPLIREFQKDPEFADIDLNTLARAYPRLRNHDIAWKDFSFATPSGKIEIFSETAQSDGLSPLPEFKLPVQGSPEFPLRLLTCHSAQSMHSQGEMDTSGIPDIHICFDTARQLNLSQKDRVRVVGENGEIAARVRIDDAVYKNTAFMYQGFWHKSGAVNFLTLERVSDMGNQPAFYDAFCRLVPV